MSLPLLGSGLLPLVGSTVNQGVKAKVFGKSFDTTKAKGERFIDINDAMTAATTAEEGRTAGGGSHTWGASGTNVATTFGTNATIIDRAISVVKSVAITAPLISPLLSP
jgi:hypothetical protein